AGPPREALRLPERGVLADTPLVHILDRVLGRPAVTQALAQQIQVIDTAARVLKPLAPRLGLTERLQLPVARAPGPGPHRPRQRLDIAPLAVHAIAQHTDAHDAPLVSGPFTDRLRLAERREV